VGLRHKPTKAKQIEILHKQKNKCFWCGRKFNSIVIKPNKELYILVPNWDHYIPFSYINCSPDYNFVASCVRCNRHKYSFVITDEKAENSLKKELIIKWYHGGWEDLRSRKHFENRLTYMQNKTKVEKIRMKKEKIKEVKIKKEKPKAKYFFDIERKHKEDQERFRKIRLRKKKGLPLYW
jgi:hypothetical protein